MHASYYDNFLVINLNLLNVLQGDLDRQRLLGGPRAGVYESVIEDGVEGIEHQER